MTSASVLEELEKPAPRSVGENVLSVHVRSVLNAVRENRGPGRKAGWRHGVPSPDR
jgi:hypothetical protein